MHACTHLSVPRTCSRSSTSVSSTLSILSPRFAKSSFTLYTFSTIASPKVASMPSKLSSRTITLLGIPIRQPSNLRHPT